MGMCCLLWEMRYEDGCLLHSSLVPPSLGTRLATQVILCLLCIRYRRRLSVFTGRLLKLHQPLSECVRHERSCHVSSWWDHVNSWWDHVSSWWGHVSSWWDHVSSRWDHVSSWWDHVSSQWDHVSSQWDHVISRGDHVRPQWNHVSSQWDHVILLQEQTGVAKDGSIPEEEWSPQ